MNSFHLSRLFLGPSTRAAAGGGASSARHVREEMAHSNSRPSSSPQHAAPPAPPQPSGLTFSSSLGGSSLQTDGGQQPLDVLLQRLYVSMAAAPACASPEDLSALQNLAVAAMTRCLADRRHADAAELYQSICVSGLLPCGVGGASKTSLLDRLALQALHQLPHQVRSSTTVARLLAAEGEADVCYVSDVSIAKTSARELASSFSLTTTPKLSAAEHFRITLHQRVQLLRAVGQLPLPLGRNYFLTEARNVLDSPTLRAEVEAEPLALLSTALLYHPFTHAQPSADGAAHLSFYDQLDLLSASAARGLSEAQREAVMDVETDVSSVRPLCHPSLRFLTTVASDWDEVLFRRVAECLLLPETALDVFPQGYRERRRERQSTRRRLSDLELETADRASLIKWTDPSHQLFPTVVSSLSSAAVATSASIAFRTSSTTDPKASLKTALTRTEMLLQRRTHRDVVVPDAGYVLGHFHQLMQLARHREVIITHGVMLELTRLAAQRSGAGRFHARRVLRTLMQRTTTDKSAQAERTRMTSSFPSTARAAHTISARRTEESGVTFLGLQDEIALLENCEARLDPVLQCEPQDTSGSTRAKGLINVSGREAAHGEDSTEHFLEDKSVRSTRRSAVLVAMQLRTMLACHARGQCFLDSQKDLSGRTLATRDSSYGGSFPSDGLLLDGEVDALVDGIVRANADASDEGFPAKSSPSRNHSSSHNVPLFKSRSRAFWAGIPVVVATTDEETRVASYMEGLQTYPPSGSA